MIVNNDELKTKLKYLGFGISKSSLTINTHVISFSTINNKVYAFTYNKINNIGIYIGDTTEDFKAMVSYDLFTKLINSCDGDIELTITTKCINIKATNLKCKVPIINMGTTYNFPNPIENKSKYVYDLNNNLKISLIKSIIDTNHIIEAYRKICFNDVILVSDTENVLKINEKIFNENVLLDFSSIELLTILNNVKYFFTSNSSNLCIMSDELFAKIEVDTNKNNDFQYTDFIDLFSTILGKKTEIDTKSLLKATNTAEIFKNPINLTFNRDGVFIKVDNNGFSYKISDKACDTYIYEVDLPIIKKICTIDNIVSIYYTNEDLIRCDNSDGSISEIISAKSIKEA